MSVRQREVGIELLRILAMLMVLGLHANFMSIPKPNANDILSVSGITKVTFESLCVCAVDVFVMISGWFGIRASLKGFCNFMWQVIFVTAFAIIFDAIYFGNTMSLKDCFKVFGLFGGGGWFVAAYIALYILSPVLNAFITNHSLKKILLFLISFFMFEILWGDTLSTDWIVCGYSAFSFIGLYVLAGFLRKLNLSFKFVTPLFVFLIAVALNTSLYVISTKLNIVAIRDLVFNYINPLVILSATSLILLFGKINPPQKKLTHLIFKYLYKNIFVSRCVKFCGVSIAWCYTTNLWIVPKPSKKCVQFI